MGSLATFGLAVFLTASGPSATEDASAKTGAPSVDGKPVEVSIGFYALDFARITAREESFDVTGYLEMSWRDPRLAPPSGQEARRRLETGRIWTPRIFFENALEPP